MRLRHRTKLAASFVITVAALPASSACNKTTNEPPRERKRVEVDTASLYVREDGRCFLDIVLHCPHGVDCNPPPPPEIDCPAEVRDAAAPATVARRPKGKEAWVRIKPHVSAWDGQCSQSPERFCAPPGKPHECTSPPDPAKLSCTALADAGAAAVNRVEGFMYKDVLGACHRVAPFNCGPGECDLPEGDIVPCP